MNEFTRWIDRIGIPEVARLCGVTRKAVYNWRDGLANPNDDLKLTIIRVSGGKVTAQVLIRHGAASVRARRGLPQGGRK